jgi:NAD+ synthase
MNLDQKISNWLENYLTHNKLDTFIIGVSGGIDSAVTSTLCALTNKPTIVVSMPIHQAPTQLQRAHDHIKWLKMNFPNILSLEYDLTTTFETFKLLFPTDDLLALANSRARLRMTTLYQVAAENKGIVVGTGNKVEDFGVGFYTKYGDGGVDISPIADLTKTEVRQLAKDLGINNEIIIAPPTDGLWGDDRTDEDQIGASYEELEWAMEFRGDPTTLTGRNKEVYYIYNNFNTKNKHKMLPIPIFKKY